MGPALRIDYLLPGVRRHSSVLVIATFRPRRVLITAINRKPFDIVVLEIQLLSVFREQLEQHFPHSFSVTVRPGYRGLKLFCL
jgi:hypothetical protein